jgi:hypothetical protein
VQFRTGENAQETLREQLGKGRWDELTKLIDDTTSIIAEQANLDVK